MLSSAHVLAMDAKNLLDVVDSIRIRYPHVNNHILRGSSVTNSGGSAGSSASSSLEKRASQQQQQQQQQQGVSMGASNSGFSVRSSPTPFSGSGQRTH